MLELMLFFDSNGIGFASNRLCGNCMDSLCLNNSESSKLYFNLHLERTEEKKVHLNNYKISIHIIYAETNFNRSDI